MNTIFRAVRVIDPLSGIDEYPRDVWVREGRIIAIDKRIQATGVPVLELGPARGASPRVLCPAFIDVHTHLREPGNEAAETVRTGARAAAAGGFGQVVAMANTRPPVDAPGRVGHTRARAAHADVRVLSVAAVTRGLRGSEIVDMHGCAAAGAAAFSDDGRNAAPPRVLRDALRLAAEAGRAVLVHPEDESMVAAANPGVPSVVRCPERPSACEAAAVEQALRALTDAGRGRLHLQHLSAAESVVLLRTAREVGLEVTAEVTPHHLSMWLPFEVEPDPPALRKVNPPLRGERDREVMVQALREGLIDCIATDHAPHVAADKEGDYVDAAPGMIGLETAFSACVTLGAMGGAWLPVLVERLTAGPWRVLGRQSGLLEPRVRAGDLATCVLLDVDDEWEVPSVPSRSLSANTPLHGVRLRGRVLLTMVEGRVVHVEAGRLTPAFTEALSV